MPMKTPAHPGRIIKESLGELNLSVADAAEGLGVSRVQLHRVLAGTSGVSPELAIRLEQGIGSSAEMWLRLQAAYDAAQVRGRKPAIHVRRLTAKPEKSPARQPAL